MKLRKKAEMVSVEDILCRKRLDWLWKLCRMDGNRLVSKVWGAESTDKRARGRPWQSFVKQEAEDLARGGLHRVQALEKVEWMRAVERIGNPVDDPVRVEV